MKTLDELGISPAPWEAEVFADGHYAYITARSVNGNKKIVGSEHSTADARLIAAAPMLYDAARIAQVFFKIMKFTVLKLNQEVAFDLAGAANMVDTKLKSALAAASGESEVAK